MYDKNRLMKNYTRKVSSDDKILWEYSIVKHQKYLDFASKIIESTETNALREMIDIENLQQHSLYKTYCPFESNIDQDNDYLKINIMLHGIDSIKELKILLSKGYYSKFISFEEFMRYIKFIIDIESVYVISLNSFGGNDKYNPLFLNTYKLIADIFMFRERAKLQKEKTMVVKTLILAIILQEYVQGLCAGYLNSSKNVFMPIEIFYQIGGSLELAEKCGILSEHHDSEFIYDVGRYKNQLLDSFGDEMYQIDPSKTHMIAIGSYLLYRKAN